MQRRSGGLDSHRLLHVTVIALRWSVAGLTLEGSNGSVVKLSSVRNTGSERVAVD
jgi:hypothetical protein